MEKTIDTSDAPELVIECKNNDLKLHGQDEHSVVVESDDEQVKVIITGNRIVISANAETEIHAPHATIVHMTDVGDLKIYEISGGIDVGNIGGDLRGEDVGAITIQNVGGDCDLEDVNGPVRISSVSGDCKLEGVTDSINIGAVGGDLKAEDVAFVGTSVSVGGDVSLKIMPGLEPGSINAGGDVSLELAEGANATLSITDSEGMRQIKFGNGTAAIKISAGGDVSVRADGEEHERGDDERSEERRVGKEC